MLKAADAELKIVIAGNHDITLDEEYYARGGHMHRYGGGMEDLKKVRELWTGERAVEAGIVYLEEGVRSFALRNGARLTVSILEYFVGSLTCAASAVTWLERVACCNLG